MLLSLLLAPLAIISVSAMRTENDAPLQGDRMLLQCAGTMSVAGAKPSEITADGLIDLARMRVRGFGLTGEEPIVYLAGGLIGFGSIHDGQGGNLVEGSIEKATGKTKLVVRAPAKPSADFMAMELTCRFLPPPA